MSLIRELLFMNVEHMEFRQIYLFTLDSIQAIYILQAIAKKKFSKCTHTFLF